MEDPSERILINRCKDIEAIRIKANNADIPSVNECPAAGSTDPAAIPTRATVEAGGTGRNIWLQLVKSYTGLMQISTRTKSNASTDWWCYQHQEYPRLSLSQAALRLQPVSRSRNKRRTEQPSP